MCRLSDLPTGVRAQDLSGDNNMGFTSLGNGFAEKFHSQPIEQTRKSGFIPFLGVLDYWQSNSLPTSQSQHVTGGQVFYELVLTSIRSTMVITTVVLLHRDDVSLTALRSCFYM